MPLGEAPSIKPPVIGEISLSEVEQSSSIGNLSPKDAKKAAAEFSKRFAVRAAVAEGGYGRKEARLFREEFARQFMAEGEVPKRYDKSLARLKQQVGEEIASKIQKAVSAVKQVYDEYLNLGSVNEASRNHQDPFEVQSDEAWRQRVKIAGEMHRQFGQKSSRDTFSQITDASDTEVASDSLEDGGWEAQLRQLSELSQEDDPRQIDLSREDVVLLQKFLDIENAKDHGFKDVSIGEYSIHAGGYLGSTAGDYEGIDTLIALDPHVNLPKDSSGEVIHIDWKDYAAPPEGLIDVLKSEVIPRLQKGEKIAVSCLGGNGRTGTLLAELLSMLEPGVEDPIAAIRERYFSGAVETLDQARAIFDLRGTSVPQRYISEFEEVDAAWTLINKLGIKNNIRKTLESLIANYYTQHPQMTENSITGREGLGVKPNDVVSQVALEDVRKVSEDTNLVDTGLEVSEHLKNDGRDTESKSHAVEVDPNRELRKAAIRELASYNRSWKVSPSDVADFYLLEPRMYRPENVYINDNEQMPLLRARARIHEIGTKLAFAALRASFIEQSSYSITSDYSPEVYVTEDLRNRLGDELIGSLTRRYLQAMVDRTQELLTQEGNQINDFGNVRKSRKELNANLSRYKEYLSTPENLRIALESDELVGRAIRFQLLEWKSKVTDVEEGKMTAEQIFADKEGLYDTLTLLKGIQSYKEWRVTADLLRAFFFPERSSDILPPNMDLTRSKLFITDRLINQAHAGGQLMEYIANDFPAMSMVLTLHGLGGNSLKHLWHYASPGLRDGLTSRDKVLLLEEKLPSDFSYTDQDRERVIEKMKRYQLDGLYAYLCGIALESEDKVIREEAIKLISYFNAKEMTRESISSAKSTIYARLSISGHTVLTDDSRTKMSNYVYASPRS